MIAYFFIQNCFRCDYDHYKVLSVIMTITVQFSNARITLLPKNVPCLQIKYLNAVANLGVILVFNELCCGMICIGKGVSHWCCHAVADTGGGAVWGNCPSQTSVAPPWMAPLCHKCAPFLVPMQVEQIKKYSKINNIFRLVKPQDLRAGLYSTTYRRAWTMLLFRNSSTVSLFLLCRVRTAQPSRLHKCSRVRSTQFSTCCCAVWKWSVFLQVYFLMPVDYLERKRKGSSKNRNAIWKTCY